MILPPLMLAQYEVSRTSPSAVAARQGVDGAAQAQAADGMQSGFGAVNAQSAQLIGCATWALLSEEAEAKLIAGAPPASASVPTNGSPDTASGWFM